VNDIFQLRALSAQRLRPFRVIPDVGDLKLTDDLNQTFTLVGEVKDTP